jgi:hypothetical protein
MPSATSFGTRGSQVQILPLRPTFGGIPDLVGAEFRKPIDPPDQDRVAELAQTYWKEGKSATPVSELLVRSARVVTKLKGKSNMKDWIDSQVTKYNPADDPPIEEMLGIESADAKRNLKRDENH